MRIWKFLRLAVAGAGLAATVVAPACKNTLEPASDNWPPLLTGKSQFTDEGPIDQNKDLRGLLMFQLRNRTALENTALAMYTQGDPTFRKYMSVADFDASYGPTQADVDQTAAWLADHGLTVERESSRRLLVEFSGTAEAIDAAFGFVIHLYHRSSAMPSDTSDDTYASVPDPSPPAGLPATLAGLIGLTNPFPLSPGPEHVPSLSSALPPMQSMYLTPPQVGAFYGFTDMAAKGMNGAGATIGIIGGYAYHDADATGFWDSWRISRDNATDQPVTGNTVTTFGGETTVDVEWAAGMAPGSNVIVYEMPDADVLSTLYALHEAVGRNEVDVVNDSFSHRDDAVSALLARSFDDAGLMAAVLGITVVSASGDSNGIDLPGASPWITSVGGTVLERDASGNPTSEHGWSQSGCGSSGNFARPSWQPPLLSPNDSGREVCDVSMDAATLAWVVNKGAWVPLGGTSLSSPLMASAIAVADGARIKAGKPRLGWINKRLYESTSVQSAFNDQTMSDSTTTPGAPGWDCTTGWGTANIGKIADADW